MSLGFSVMDGAGGRRVYDRAAQEIERGVVHKTRSQRSRLYEVAVGLLDHVAEVNANAELDAALARQARITFDHADLHFNRAAHGVDHGAEFDQHAVTGALDHAAVVHGDGRVDQITA